MPALKEMSKVIFANDQTRFFPLDVVAQSRKEKGYSTLLFWVRVLAQRFSLSIVLIGEQKTLMRMRMRMGKYYMEYCYYVQCRNLKCLWNTVILVLAM